MKLVWIVLFSMIGQNIVQGCFSDAEFKTEYNKFKDVLTEETSFQAATLHFEKCTWPDTKKIFIGALDSITQYENSLLSPVKSDDNQEYSADFQAEPDDYKEYIEKLKNGPEEQKAEFKKHKIKSKNTINLLEYMKNLSVARSNSIYKQFLIVFCGLDKDFKIYEDNDSKKEIIYYDIYKTKPNQEFFFNSGQIGWPFTFQTPQNDKNYIDCQKLKVDNSPLKFQPKFEANSMYWRYFGSTDPTSDFDFSIELEYEKPVRSEMDSSQTYEKYRAEILKRQIKIVVEVAELWKEVSQKLSEIWKGTGSFLRPTEEIIDSNAYSDTIQTYFDIYKTDEAVNDEIMDHNYEYQSSKAAIEYTTCIGSNLLLIDLINKAQHNYLSTLSKNDEYRKVVEEFKNSVMNCKIFDNDYQFYGKSVFLAHFDLMANRILNLENVQKDAKSGNNIEQNLIKIAEDNIEALSSTDKDKLEGDAKKEAFENEKKLLEEYEKKVRDNIQKMKQEFIIMPEGVEDKLEKAKQKIEKYQFCFKSDIETKYFWIYYGLIPSCNVWANEASVTFGSLYYNLPESERAKDMITIKPERLKSHIKQKSSINSVSNLAKSQINKQKSSVEQNNDEKSVNKLIQDLNGGLDEKDHLNNSSNNDIDNAKTNSESQASITYTGSVRVNTESMLENMALLITHVIEIISEEKKSSDGENLNEGKVEYDISDKLKYLKRALQAFGSLIVSFLQSNALDEGINKEFIDNYVSGLKGILEKMLKLDKTLDLIQKAKKSDPTYNKKMTFNEILNCEYFSADGESHTCKMLEDTKKQTIIKSNSVKLDENNSVEEETKKNGLDYFLMDLFSLYNVLIEVAKHTVSHAYSPVIHRRKIRNLV